MNGETLCGYQLEQFDELTGAWECLKAAKNPPYTDQKSQLAERRQLLSMVYSRYSAIRNELRLVEIHNETYGLSHRTIWQAGKWADGAILPAPIER
jgi:hypothetical protein